MKPSGPGNRARPFQFFLSQSGAWHGYGCGLCENRCPVSTRAATGVFSTGETRDPRNRLQWTTRALQV